MIAMTEKERFDEGLGLWYIVLEHSNQRYVNGRNEPFIFDDVEVAEARAKRVTSRGQGKHLPMMVMDFNLRYKKHMPVPAGFEELRSEPRAFKRID